jgi:translation initiation factor IF-3
MIKKPQVFLNERVLKFRDVLVINSDGQSLGVMGSRKALDIAQNQGLDLFLVSPNSNPIVCKILDYGKHKYEEDKKLSASHKPKQETKEIKISPRIQQHDLNTFINRAIKFLQHGDKVKVTCVFKAREIEHPQLGYDKIVSVLEAIEFVGLPEDEPVLLGKMMSVMVNPKK